MKRTRSSTPAEPATPKFKDEDFFDSAQTAALKEARPDHTLEWHKLTLTVRDQRDLVIAMPLARAIATYRAGCQHLYFARYTSPKPRIEYQFAPRTKMVPPNKPLGRPPNWEQDLTCYIRRICRKAGLEDHGKVKFKMESCQGSWPHALAFRVACAMEDDNSNSASLAADVVHWLYNMLGFTYAQEAESCLKQAHMGLVNSVGYHKEPWFENPFVALRKAQLKEIEENRRKSPGKYRDAFARIRHLKK